jgi:hypothetical protein
MATPSEAFIGGMICAALDRADSMYEVITAEAPDDSRPACVVLRGRKTGIEVIVTVTETRHARKDEE